MDNAHEQPTVFDTDQQYLGNVYAKALIGIGLKSGNTDSLLSELKALTDEVLPKLPKLRQVLESPRISFDEKSKVLDKALKGKASDQFLNFLKVLTRNHRFDCLSAVDREATRMHNEMSGRVEATLTTASDVDDSIKQRIAEKLEGVLNKQVVLSTQVDESIIGGFVVRVGDTVFDGSLANQLSQVRRSAVDKANQEIRKSIERFTVGT